MLGDCVPKICVSKSSYKGMLLVNQSKCSVLAAKHLCGVSYRKMATWVNGKTEGLRFVIAIGVY